MMTMEGAALAQSYILPKNAGQVEQSAQVSCHGDSFIDSDYLWCIMENTQDFQVILISDSLTFRIISIINHTF